MKKVLKIFLLATSMVFSLSSCSKDNDGAGEINTPTFTGPNPAALNLSVRVIYIVPTDRKLNNAYTEAVGNCITQLSNWYKTTLGSNKTFRLNSNMLVETIQSSHPASWFNEKNSNTGDASFYFYGNAKADTKSLLGTGYDESKNIYLVYVDAAGSTGAGAIGFTAMPENDLKGLTNQMSEPVSRWIGGAGHELGHAFGLPHPANENPQALMWTGYTNFPNCILQEADKTILNSNKFLY